MKAWLWPALFVLAGVVFADKIRQIPAVGQHIPTI